MRGQVAFQKGIAATAMESIVEKAVEEMRAEPAAWQEAAARNAAAAAARSRRRGGGCGKVVGGCGGLLWLELQQRPGPSRGICDGRVDEMRHLSDFVSVASGHAGKQHLKFQWLVDRLGAATNHLWQTNKEDHEQAKKNKESLV